MIKQLVMIYVNTITVRMQAIRSASVSVLPAFSPRALAHILQMLIATFNNVLFFFRYQFLLQMIQQ